MGGACSHKGRSQRGAGRRAAAGLGQLRRQTLEQLGQLLLPLPDEVVQVALADQEGGFGADEAAVVAELGFGEVARQNGVDHTLPTVQVLLQLPGVFGLEEEQRAFVMKGVLRTTKTKTQTLNNISVPI